MKHEDMPRVRYAAAGGVVVHEGRVLLLDWPDRGEVRLPKGHIDPGETAVEAALREVREETGYADLVVLAELSTQTVEFIDKDRRVTRDDTYFMLGLAGQAQIERDEHECQFRPIWVPLKEALTQLTFEAEREFLRRALNRVQLY